MAVLEADKAAIANNTNSDYLQLIECSDKTVAKIEIIKRFKSEY